MRQSFRLIKRNHPSIITREEAHYGVDPESRKQKTDSGRRRRCIVLPIMLLPLVVLATILNTVLMNENNLTSLVLDVRESPHPPSPQQHHDEDSTTVNKLNITRDAGAFAVGTLLLQNIPTTANNSMIPKVINKVLITGDAKTPQFDSQSQLQRDALLSWTNMNPGYTIRYFGLDDCRSYLQKYFHPAVLRAFDCMKANAWKVNMFRAAVIYREGGWYSDWKETVLHKGLLDEVSNADIVFTWDRGTPEHRERGCIMNAFFGALPGDPMLGEAIKIMVTNAQREFYGLDPQTYGPCALGEAFDNTYRKTSWRRNSRIQNGMYKWNDYYLNHGKKIVIRHKYHDPSGLTSDSWTDYGGNDYRKMWAERQSFCSSTISIIDPI